MSDTICSGCQGERFVRCQSLCPQCGGTGTNIIGGPARLQFEVAKGKFTDLDGQLWEFERIGERP